MEATLSAALNEHIFWILQLQNKLTEINTNHFIIIIIILYRVVSKYKDVTNVGNDELGFTPLNKYECAQLFCLKFEVSCSTTY